MACDCPRNTRRIVELRSQRANRRVLVLDVWVSNCISSKLVGPALSGTATGALMLPARLLDRRRTRRTSAWTITTSANVTNAAPVASDRSQGTARTGKCNRQPPVSHALRSMKFALGGVRVEGVEVITSLRVPSLVVSCKTSPLVTF